MTPPIWTHGDEALWHAYACAAMAGGTMNAAASWADDMLKEHRRRWPAPVLPGESAAEHEALDAILRAPPLAPEWLREAVTAPRPDDAKAERARPYDIAAELLKGIGAKAIEYASIEKRPDGEQVSFKVNSRGDSFVVSVARAPGAR